MAQFVRAVTGLDPAGPSDGELLRRFAETRDQAAFELLVWRHAGMLLRICRRQLRDWHAAEDAVQATFLALAKKADSVRENPAGWLYRVAVRIAGKIVVKPVVVREMPQGAAPLDDDTAILHEELNHLPEKYRVPVLLCFFEGLTHAEAAHRLGWPTGSVAGRIARAKDLLHARLTRRGVSIPAAGVAAMCAADGITKSFAQATASAAGQFATGTTPAVAPHIPTLAMGALHAMTIAKIKTVGLAACALVAVASLGSYGLSQQTATVLQPPTVRVDTLAAPNWWLVTYEPIGEAPPHESLSLKDGQRTALNFMPLRSQFSPDGKRRLVVKDGRELMIETIDRPANAYDRYVSLTTTLFLSKNTARPVWSADGQHVAFVSIDINGRTPRPSTGIEVVTINGKTRTEFPKLQYSIGMIRFVPGTRQLLFTEHSEAINPNAFVPPAIINKENSFDIVLTDGTTNRKTILEKQSIYDFAVSPDGKTIAVAGNELTLYRLDDMTKLASITMADVNAEWPVVFTHLAWRPDGKAIAFKPKFVGGIAVGPGQRFEDIRTPGDAHVGVAMWDGGEKLTAKTYEVGRNFVPSHWSDRQPQPAAEGGMGMPGIPGVGGESGPPAIGSPDGGAPAAPPPPPAKPLVRLPQDKDAPSPLANDVFKRNANFESRMDAKRNLKAIAMAILNYEAAHTHLPDDVRDATGKPLLSWRIHLLPFFGDPKLDALYRQFKFDEPFDSKTNAAAASRMPDVYRSAFQPANATTTYVQRFVGPDAWPSRKTTIVEYADGTSNTIGIAEVGPPVPWTKPADVVYDATKSFPKVVRPYANVINVAFVDGTSHWLKPSMGEYAWRRYVERDDGMNIDHAAQRAAFKADSAEEKETLVKQQKANLMKIQALEEAFTEQIALLKLQNALELDPEKNHALGDILERMLETFVPRNKKLRNELGLRPNARIPKPEDLERKP
jgi:DNA-directed RNA polymerase specialized sigma24 family protein/Tol biopolymer transport system component